VYLSPCALPLRTILALTKLVYAFSITMSLPPELTERYATIKAAQSKQQAKYDAWIASDEVDQAALTAQAASVGMTVDVPSGQIAYAADFEAKRLPLCFDLLYCRHGKTTGNTEPRVYQGYVDEPNNALNEIGLQQAEDAADKLDGMQLSPDLVVLSPLSRAAETGRAYVKRHAELAAKTEEWDDSAEMRFGAWDNKMVKDLEDDNICHLFYLAQNAVVKTAAPYRDPASGKEYAAESFVEVLTRMNGVLARLNERMAVAAEGRRPLVVMYGHSMCGAALAILTGNGKQVDGESYLGFDGKYIMPNATPVFLHKA
jgi:broad specificity phosphatase PhoE